jgi:hypothetical protein
LLEGALAWFVRGTQQILVPNTVELIENAMS